MSNKASTGAAGSGFRKFVSANYYDGKAETASAYNNTAVQYQEIRVYIEGVQVPFVSASISQTYGALPTATIDIPPESGLLDITRGYQPKVHIFYEDRISGGLRLLFWGTIAGCSYSRSREQGGTYISFNCVHKNNLVQTVLLDYSGWTQPNSTEIQDSEGAVRAGNFNSAETIVEALRGINGVATEAKDKFIPTNTDLANSDSSMLDPSIADHLDRLIGVPGCAVNLWNQFKKYSYINPEMNINVSAMTAPLVEEALGFFKRMTGHKVLEQAVQNGREAYCNERGVEKHTLVPPAFQNPLLSALKTELAANVIRTQIGHSGEYTDYLTLINSFLTSIYYDLITLASPAEVSLSPAKGEEIPDSGYDGKKRIAVETLIKPQLPFYYSPVCNVLLPRMYDTVSIQQQESSVPTRILAYHSVDNSGGSNLLIRAPHTIREATAYGGMIKNAQYNNTPILDLSTTFGVSFNVPGKFEQGTGIRPTKTALPWWLSTICIGQNVRGTPSEASPSQDSPEYDDAKKLSAAWDERYSRDYSQVPPVGADNRPVNNDKKVLNPYNIETPTVSAFQRVLLVALDYEYSKAVSGARSGSVECVFNPYIIPGYPMDVIDDSPNHPCFHGLCTSVTHSFTANSISTSVGMTAVMTYAELSNFYTPPVHPSIQINLGIVNGTSPDYKDIRSTIIQNPEAKAIADEFYMSVLGVGAAAIDELYDFQTGRVNGLSRHNGQLYPMGVHEATHEASNYASNGGDLNDYLTTVGNLRLIHRKIETKASIESGFGYTFIDLTPANYNESVVRYVPPISASGLMLEPGASLFLDYLETPDFINLSKKRNES